MEEVCNNPNIPERLHTNGRTANQNFSLEEFLYSRFKFAIPFDEWKNNRSISASIIQLTRQGDSFNRELYCDSYADVLLNPDPTGGDLSEYGVFGIKCGIIIECDKYTDEIGNEFALSIKHDPEPCMFPHTIMPILKNGTHDITVKNKLANAEFRDVLISNLSLFKPLDIS